jgi:hypothetical protein
MSNIRFKKRNDVLKELIIRGSPAGLIEIGIGVGVQRLMAENEIVLEEIDDELRGWGWGVLG